MASAKYSTPPCLNAQLVDLFWAHGKNDAASCLTPKNSLPNALCRALRNIWYGRGHRVGKAHVQHLLIQDEIVKGTINLETGVMELETTSQQLQDQHERKTTVGRALDKEEAFVKK